MGKFELLRNIQVYLLKFLFIIIYDIYIDTNNKQLKYKPSLECKNS